MTRTESDALPQVVDQLNENERLVVELETDWNDKVQCTQEFITEKVVELEGLGVIHAANPTALMCTATRPATTTTPACFCLIRQKPIS